MEHYALTILVLHEGVHVADRSDFVATLRATGATTKGIIGSIDPVTNITLFESEIRAFTSIERYSASRAQKELKKGPYASRDLKTPLFPTCDTTTGVCQN